MNGISITGREPPMWIIDFEERSEGDAALYASAFERVRALVKPERDTIKRERRRRLWWIHGEVNNALRSAVLPLSRYLATCQTAKHRTFVWTQSIVLPAQTVIAFARTDDFFLGLLQSHIHVLWGLRLGTRLETRPRYTPTTCFETFPFPEPTDEQREAIAAAARELDQLRNNWLNPPEWTRQEILEFPGTIGGSWSRYINPPLPLVEEPPRRREGRGEGKVAFRSRESTPHAQREAPTSTPHSLPPTPSLGTVRYPRLIPKDAECAKHLAKRTLTNLYNTRPTWLDLAHRRLDAAVSAAYGWTADLSDDEILGQLLALNLKRARNKK